MREKKGLLDFVPLAGAGRQVTETFSLVRLTSVLRASLSARSDGDPENQSASLAL
jgi:hypothetical protein